MRKKKHQNGWKAHRHSQYRLQNKLALTIRHMVGRGDFSTKPSPYGYTRRQLIDHIEALWDEGMSWENYGRLWIIDHKKATAEFDLEDPLQRFAANQLSNLQPLWKSAHYTKHRKRKLHEQALQGL